MSVSRWLPLFGVCLTMAVATATLLNTGCEEATGTYALVVEPSFADLRADFGNATATNSTAVYIQTFTVTDESLRDLSLPLKWSVSNPELGTIAYEGGASASYTRIDGAHGDNGILVEDQYGARGTATVRQ